MVSPARIRRLFGLVLALGLVLPACSRKNKPDEDPPKDPPVTVAPGDPNAKRPGPVPPKENQFASQWAATAIPIDHQKAVTFGPTGCPVLVVGPTVFATSDYKAVQFLSDPYEPQAMRALSSDGKYFAAASKSPNQEMTGVAVWSTENAKRLLDVPGKKDAYVDIVSFLGNAHLLLGGRHDRNLDVWEIAGRKIIGRLTVPDNRVESDKVAFSPDGKHFAGIAHDKLVLSDVATNKPIATMAPPAEEIGKPGKPGDTDPIFIHAWSRGLAFSPDGSEIALFSTHPSPRLIVWNLRGQMQMDIAVPMPQFVVHRRALEWMPDGSGWLVHGHAVDRATRRVVVSMRIPFASDVIPHFLDKDRIIGVYGDDRERLQTITMPWNKIQASLKSMASKSDAFLSPGEPVSLQLDLTGLRGDEAETRKLLTDAVTKRLARDGIAIAANRPTTFRLKLAEQAGERLPIYQRQSPFDRRGSDTGRKATEAKGAAVLELWAQGESQPLWRGHLNAASGGSFTEEINDATLRKSMLGSLTNQLSGMDVPYFIPKAKGVVALPAVVE